MKKSMITEKFSGKEGGGNHSECIEQYSQQIKFEILRYRGIVAISFFNF